MFCALVRTSLARPCEEQNDKTYKFQFIRSYQGNYCSFDRIFEKNQLRKKFSLEFYLRLRCTFTSNNTVLIYVLLYQQTAYSLRLLNSCYERSTEDYLLMKDGSLDSSLTIWLGKMTFEKYLVISGRQIFYNKISLKMVLVILPKVCKFGFHYEACIISHLLIFTIALLYVIVKDTNTLKI